MEGEKFLDTGEKFFDSGEVFLKKGEVFPVKGEKNLRLSTEECELAKTAF